jgi:uncharacterized protein YndB with AHSA1/START domain
MEDLGTYTETTDGKVKLRFERLYPRPIEIVWAALTTPERLSDWLGAVDVEPRVGGRFNCFVNRDEEARTRGDVLSWEPPRLLEFSWSTPDSPEDTKVRCELSDAGGGRTRLVFTHCGMERKWMGLVFPGWHRLLERLGKLMNGEPTASPDGRWRELQGVYLERHQLKDVLTDPPLPQGKYK